jgi:hypothetical protein
MELLLSGALVFGLAQLPRELDALFYSAFNRLAAEQATVALLVWVYAKVALVTLIGTFVLHLVARGYWVALVGLDSVYPGGIRWDRLLLGPHLRAVSREGGDDMASRIEGADNAASRIFGVGIGLALAMMVPLAFAAVGALLNPAIAWIFPRASEQPWGFWLIGILLAAYTLVYLVDRRLGHRFAPGSVPARGLRVVFRRTAFLGMGRPNNALIAIFQGAEGAGRTTLVILAVIVPVMGLVGAQLLADADGWDLGRFVGLPDDRPGTADVLLPGHYGNLRGDGRTVAPIPFIPERLVRGPYVELFVPYLPRRETALVAERCRGAVAALAGGAPPRAAVDCVGALHPVTLDGAPITVAFDAASDPLTGNRGLLAMIPAAGLSPGRHELTVGRPPPAARDGKKAQRPPYRILFWR